MHLGMPAGRRSPLARALAVCTLLAASTSAAGTRVANVQELQLAVEQGDEIIVLTEHMYLECRTAACQMNVRGTTRAIVGECADAPLPAFFAQSSRSPFSAAPVTTTAFRAGQCALLAEAAPMRATASPLWLHNLYLLFDAAEPGSVGLGTPADALFMTNSIVTSTAAALLVEDAYFSEVTFFNCEAPQQAFSTSVAGAAVFEKCAFEYGAVALGLSIGSQTIITDTSFFRTGCDAAPGGGCTGDDLGIIIPYQRPLFTDMGDPQDESQAELFITNSPVTVQRSTAEHDGDEVNTETLFANDFEPAEAADVESNLFLTADDPWFLETQALYAAAAAATNATVAAPAANATAAVTPQEPAPAPTELAPAPAQVTGSMPTTTITDVEELEATEEQPVEVESPQTSEQFMPVSTAGMPAWLQVQQRWV